MKTWGNLKYVMLSESQHDRLHTIRFHLYDSLERAKGLETDQ